MNLVRQGHPLAHIYRIVLSVGLHEVLLHGPALELSLQAVEHDAVLHIGFVVYADGLALVAPDGGKGGDHDPPADRHVADHRGERMDIGGGVDGWHGFFRTEVGHNVLVNHNNTPFLVCSVPCTGSMRRCAANFGPAGEALLDRVKRLFFT